jgi:hypothetical protein
MTRKAEGSNLFFTRFSGDHVGSVVGMAPVTQPGVTWTADDTPPPVVPRSALHARRNPESDQALRGWGSQRSGETIPGHDQATAMS